MKNNFCTESIDFNLHKNNYFAFKGIYLKGYLCTNDL
jgi:hypothetical protein